MFGLVISFAAALKLKDALNFDNLNSWLIAIATFLLMFYLNVSLFAFFLVYIECYILLKNWANHLQVAAKENIDYCLQNSLKFFECLQLVTNVFSRSFFYALIIWMVDFVDVHSFSAS